tara:strand:- start:103 stop:372 length:270 start_codon:yes stop_codon:yes gene_type:complete
MKKNPSTNRPDHKSIVKVKSLHLINDDYNSFEYVVDCLMAICDHTLIQAEQCALLTHYKGSCEIMSADKIDLEPVKEDLILYGLNVRIF